MDWMYEMTVLAACVAVPIGYWLQRVHEIPFKNFLLIVFIAPLLMFGVLCAIAAFVQGLDAPVGTPAAVTFISAVTLAPFVVGAFLAQMHKQFRYRWPQRARVRVSAKA